MIIESIELTTVMMTLLDPFTSATSQQATRSLLIVAVTAGDHTGWGECSADGTSYCLGESADTARAILSEAAPHYIGQPVAEPRTDHRLIDTPMAAAALDSALWDLYAKSIAVPLAIALGGSIRTIASRAVLGRADDLVGRADHAIASGYQSIKIKLASTDDLADLATIRSNHPNAAMAVDLNGSASSVPPVKTFYAELDELALDFIEQPYEPANDTRNFALAASSVTPICLDESVRTLEAAVTAVQGGCLINAKAAKFGGPTASIALLDQIAGDQVWWGGMLETGIGRAHSLALATRPGPRRASDLSASNRYYEHDITQPWTLRNGGLTPIAAPGIGVEVDREWLKRYSTQSETISS